MKKKYKIAINYTLLGKATVKWVPTGTVPVIIDGILESIIHFKKGKVLHLAIPESSFISLERVEETVASAPRKIKAVDAK